MYNVLYLKSQDLFISSRKNPLSFSPKGEMWMLLPPGGRLGRG